MIDSLFHQYRHLIHRCIARYCGIDPAVLSEQDLKQEAYAAIQDALINWNPSKGAPFATYLRFYLQKQFTKAAGEKHYNVILTGPDGSRRIVPYASWRKRKATLARQGIHATLERRFILKECSH